MTRIAAGKFKDQCLRILDRVAETKSSIVVTKRGRPVAVVGPVLGKGPADSLAGSILRERGDPFRTGEAWDADRP